MQPAELLVEIGKTGRQPGQPAIALIGGVGDVHRIGGRLQEALKAAFGAARLGQRVKPLFGLDDLLGGVRIGLDAGRAVGDLGPQRHQLAPDRQIIDHLGIVAGGKA